MSDLRTTFGCVKLEKKKKSGKSVLDNVELK